MLRITDWLDGYLARSSDQVSAFGAFLDPVADKLMVAAALIVLVSEPAERVIAVIIIGREIAISALREWMAQLGQAKSVAVPDRQDQNRGADGGDTDAALSQRDRCVPAAAMGHRPDIACGSAYAVVHVLLPQDGGADGD